MTRGDQVRLQYLVRGTDYSAVDGFKSRGEEGGGRIDDVLKGCYQKPDSNCVELQH